MAEHDTATFTIAMRGLASLSGLSGLLGEATGYNTPEPGKGSAEGEPMVSWSLASGLIVVLFIAPNREHVLIADQPEHPLYRAVHEMCSRFEIDIDVVDDDGSPADAAHRMRRH